MVDHFLITRFNLKKADWERDKSNNVILDYMWIKNRIELFKNYCLPSVLGQSNSAFQWLIFVEKDSKEQIGELLELVEKYHFIEVIFIDGYVQFQFSISRIIKQRVNRKSQKIITSRLDNDDALHKDFIREVQNNARNASHNTIISFPYGLCLDIREPQRLADQFHHLNQFISLVEKNEPYLKISTVYINKHNCWGRDYEVINNDRKGMWLQIAHDNNMINEFSGILAYSSSLRGFSNLSANFPMYYDVEIFFERIKIVLKRKFRLLKKRFRGLK